MDGEVGRQPVGVGALLPPGGFWGSKPGHLAAGAPHHFTVPTAVLSAVRPLSGSAWILEVGS